MLPRDDLEAWVAAYITYQSSPWTSRTGEHPQWWAVERALDVGTSGTDPEDLWQFILAVLAKRPSEDVLGILSAGALEDFVEYHGHAFIDRIEAKAADDPAFRALLSGIWQSGTPEVWARIQRAIGVSGGEA